MSEGILECSKKGFKIVKESRIVINLLPLTFIGIVKYTVFKDLKTNYEL